MPKVKIPRQWKWGSVPEEILNSSLSTQAKLLIAAITYHAWDDGPAWPGQDRLARLCSCSRSAIIRAVKDLERLGFLRVDRAKGKVNSYEFIAKTSVPGTQVPPLPVPVGNTPCVPGEHLPVPVGNTNKTKDNKTQEPLPDTASLPTPLKTFTDWWIHHFRQVFGTPFHFTPRDGMAAAALVKTYTFSELQKLVTQAWASDKEFVASRSRAGVYGFAEVVNQVGSAQKMVKPMTAYEREQAEKKTQGGSR